MPEAQGLPATRSQLVAPEIAAAISSGVIAAPVTFTVTAIRIEIAPFAAVFATVAAGIIAVDFARTGAVSCNNYRFNGIGAATDHRG
jgi:L-serine deaminase